MASRRNALLFVGAVDYFNDPTVVAAGSDAFKKLRPLNIESLTDGRRRVGGVSGGTTHNVIAACVVYFTRGV